MAIRLARLRAAGLTHVGVRPAPKGHQTAYIAAHGIGDANHHLEVRLRVRDFAGLLHQLQIAAGICISSRFFVRIRRRQNYVGDGRGFGQEHVLHHHKSFRERKGINLQTANRIRAHHVQRFQFAGLRRFHHLRQAQAFFGGQTAPFLLELVCAGDGFVSRQKIGIKAHFAGAARIRVIAQADQLGSSQG